MSNNLYNILNNFNKVANLDQPEKQEQPRAKTQLQESMEQVLSEKYMGFEKVAAAAKAGGAKDPEAVAASIGRKKYGKKKFQKAAAQGKKLKESAKPDYIDLDHDGNTTEPMKQAAKDAKAMKETEWDEVEDDEQEKRDEGFFVVIGSEEAGEPFIGMIHKDGGKWRETAISGPAPYNWGSSYMSYLTPEDVMSWIEKDYGRHAQVDGPFFDEESANDHANYFRESAPPGAKAERMVKHIKQGYAKDGKLTGKEKSIAYATAWKAKKAGKLEENYEEDNPVVNAITHRIMRVNTDLLAKYGPEKVGQAIDEVADFVGEVEEIGSSDVSGWVRHVAQMLGNMPDEQNMAESDSKKTFKVVYYSPKTDRNVTKIIKANNESDIWDKFKLKGVDVVSVKQQGVAEGEMNTGYMNKQHQDFYDKNPNFKRSDREKKFVGNQLASKVMPTNKPGQVAKKPMTSFNTKGVAEGDDEVDIEPALHGLKSEFDKFLKHGDRMDTDPTYAKKWNKRYAKYAGHHHNDLGDMSGDEEGVAEGEVKKTKSGIMHHATKHYTGAGMDDDLKAVAVKKGRGRPKKGADSDTGEEQKWDTGSLKGMFGSMPKKLPGAASVKHRMDETAIDKLIQSQLGNLLEGSIQGGVWTAKPPKPGQADVPVPQDIDGASAAKVPAKTTSAAPAAGSMGSIKGGVWTATPPKKGEKGVAVPQGIDEGRSQYDMEIEDFPNPAFGPDSSEDIPETINVGVNYDYSWSGKYYPQTLEEPAEYPELDVTIHNVYDLDTGNEITDTVDMAGIEDHVREKVESMGADDDSDRYDEGKSNALSEMLRLAGLSEAKMADKDYDGDGKIESGKDEYLGSKIAAAKKAGKLKEATCKTCNCSPCECDKKLDECMSPLGGEAQSGHDMPGRMDISTNMSSDGNRSVTINASNEAAVQLMQMLKLAGLDSQGSDMPHTPDAVAVVVDAEDAMPDAPEEVAEEKDERYHANTTPEEHVMPVQVQIKGGDGDVAGREKVMRKHGYQFADNPLAMSEGMTRQIMREYEGIKVKR